MRSKPNLINPRATEFPKLNMEHLMQQVRKALVETQQLMHSLSQGHGDLQGLETRVEEGVQQLEQDCYRLENYARKEIPQRRQEAKYRVDQVVSEVNDLKRIFEVFKHHRQNAELEARQREELLSRRFTPNIAGGLLYNALIHAVYTWEPEFHGFESHLRQLIFCLPCSEQSSIPIDDSLQHHSRLKDANAQLDEIIYHGQTTFSSLKSQYLTLKGAQRKILDVMNTLGLSNTVMRLIERRTAQDKWIFWTGIVLSVTIMVLVVMYFT